MTRTGSAPAVTEIEDVLALSPLQEGLFTLARAVGEGIDPYTIQFVADIEGRLDVPLLRTSIDSVLIRHPNLRVSFWDRDLPHPVQIVPTRVDVPFREVECHREDFGRLAEAERRTAFDLESGPLLRFVLARAGEQSFRLICTAHHIVMDGWSVPIFVHELLGAYLVGGSLDAVPAPRLYRDYIAWLTAQDRDRALDEWRGRLAAIDGPTMLTEGRSRSAAPRFDALPEKAEFALGSSDTEALVRWTRACGLTVNTATQFAWALLLARLTNQSGVVFGTTVAGRPDGLSGVEKMIGLFINTLPVHIRFDDRTIAEQCRALQQESARLHTHGYLGLSTLQRVAGHGDLFDSLLVFQNAPRGNLAEAVTAPDGVRFTPVEMDSLTHYPLTLVPYLDGEIFGLVVEHRPDLLPHLSAREIGQRLLHILRQLPALSDARPDAVDILLPGEGERILGEAVTPAPVENPPACTIHELLEYRAAETPDALAVSAGEATFTYAAVNDAANRLAAELIDRGLRPEETVAIALPRSPEFLIALFAVAKAGGTAVPLGIDLPEAREESILTQTGTRLVVTTPAAAPNRPGLEAVDIDTLLAEPGAPSANPRIPVDPAQSAYIIFTSGSTGEPKGVVASHLGIVRLLADHRQRVYAPAVERLGRTLTVGHAWSLTFDASWQPLLALLDGHTLALLGSEAMRDPDLLVQGIVEAGIDMLETSPSLFIQLASAGLLVEKDGETRCLLPILGLGGEAVGEQTWAQLRALPGTEVYNFYGPTETTVDALVAAFADSPTPSVGRPVSGMGAYLLDSALRLVPDGVAGELYLSGEQLARGYLGRPDLTATRFVASPFASGQRLYRTGDLMRRTATGLLSYLGRSDDQVKIRGFRIELAEVEGALRALPSVTAAAVLVTSRTIGPGLSAFVVSTTGTTTASALRGALADMLPTYMIPSRFTFVETLPLTANGKLDSRALVELEKASRAVDVETVAALSEKESLLLRLLAELLGEPGLGIDSDFFDLGVDSIVAISLVNRARANGIVISPRMVATYPSVRELVAASEEFALVPVEDRRTDTGEVLPIPIVRWLYEFEGFRRFTQTQLVRLPTGIDEHQLVGVLQALLDTHEMLRASLVRTEAGPRVLIREVGAVTAAEVVVTVDEDLAGAARAAIDRIDPERGSMLHAMRHRQILLLTIHHLAVDAVSWNVILADLAEAWAARGTERSLPPATTSYRRWSELMIERADSPEVLAQRDYWLGQCAGDDPALGSRRIDPRVDRSASIAVRTVVTSTETTTALLDRATRAAGVREILLTALTLTVAGWRKRRGENPAAGTLLDVEGHGRSDHLAADPRVDTSRTVGWFTTVFPVRLGRGTDWAGQGDLDRPDPAAVHRLLSAVATTIAGIPHAGNDYGLLRYQRNEPGLRVHPQIEFNYLGRFDLGERDHDRTGDWSLVTDRELHEHLPLVPEPELPVRYELEVISAVGAGPDGPEVVTSWRYSRNVFSENEIDAVVQLWDAAIGALAILPNGGHAR